LKTQIRRGVQEQPFFAGGGNNRGRLGLPVFEVAPGYATIVTIAIPLRNSTARCRTKDPDLHGMLKKPGFFSCATIAGGDDAYWPSLT
jgi:hypothetical protein